MSLTVYLDTNIIIDGPKRPEHIRLNELAVKGDIRLFIGDEVSEELRERIYNLREDKSRLYREEKKYDRKEFYKELNRIDGSVKSVEKQLKEELDFWRPSKPGRPKNTFRGLFLIMGGLGIYEAYRCDTKRELAYLSELQTKYNIVFMDGLHLMQAHSSKIDYFLTWDRKKLINRANRVPWLFPKVMTPKDFLSCYRIPAKET